MPDVKAGSIIELEYTVVSPYYYNLSSWDFQYQIPVLLSSFQVSVPDTYQFTHTLVGDIDITKEEKYIIRTSGGSTTNAQYRDISTTYSAENILPFKQEPYLRNPFNYISNIYFELSSTSSIEYGNTNYSSSWIKLDKDLTLNPDFGVALKRDNHLDEIADSIKELSDSEIELATIALSTIQERIEWDEICSRSLRKILKDGYGNSADINLNLVALLRLLGLESNPLLLSTQSNGIARTSVPSSSCFNYLIATVKIDDEDFILDATDIDSRINIVPYRALNYKGRVITPTHGYWLDLEGYSSAKESTFYNIDINKELKIEGVFQNKSTDYAAYDKIKDICSYQYVDEYEDELENRIEGLSLRNLTITNIDDRNVVLKADLIDPDLIDRSADTIYIPTVIEPFLDGNPFDMETRKYPIEFNVAASEEYICNISIPEGYQFTQIPKPVLIKSEDQSIIFKYQVAEEGSSAVVRTSLSIKKTIFLPNEYEVLRQIFQLVYDKQHEKIIIEKI